VLKGIGTGLTSSLRTLEVGVDGGSRSVAGWRVEDLQVFVGHMVSVATLPASSLTLHPALPAASERSSSGHVHS
jgi:hypothetical protein